MNSVEPKEFPMPASPSENEFIIIYNGTTVKLLNLTLVVEAIAKLKLEMPVADYNKLNWEIMPKKYIEIIHLMLN